MDGVTERGPGQLPGSSSFSGAGPWVEVVVDVAIRRTADVFHYRIPEPMRRAVRLGSRVEVPFGRRRVTGTVVGFPAQPHQGELKDIVRVLAGQPALPASLVGLARALSEHYLCATRQCLWSMVVPGLWGTRHRLVVLKVSPSEAESWIERHGRRMPRQAAILEEVLEAGGEVVVTSLADAVGSRGLSSALRRLEEQGLVSRESTAPRAASAPGTQWLLIPAWPGDALRAAADALQARAPKQAALLRQLAQTAGNTAWDPARLAQTCRTGRRTVLSLVEKGFVRMVEMSPLPGPAGAVQRGPELTREQAQALDGLREVLAAAGSTALLEGVTGSGKTEVYLRLIEECLDQDAGAIVLVPEIALTPQMTERFRARFGSLVGVWHSGMSLGDRQREWWRVRRGESRVVIGPRSAVFAPVYRLRLVVVDEEHEPSYKQECDPRYHARTVARLRARLEGASVLLGSATPSLESRYRAERGEYAHFRLPTRVARRPLPPVELVDLRQERPSGALSGLMVEAIREALGAGGQVILFLNRRGFSAFILCRECGWVVRCPQCEVTLTYHRTGRRLRCHYCGYDREPPWRCPACGGYRLGFHGVGTQRVEEEVREFFPGVEVARMDLDTMGYRGAHERVYREFREGRIRVLVGTQMLAKGFHVEGVTLVGVVSADTALNLPDFRAAERTFQLLTQVAGRAGRGGAPGRVVVQTYAPDHYAIQAASRHDFETFYRTEVSLRQELGYPPFADMVRLLISARSAAEVEAYAQKLGAVLRAGPWRLLGPAPAPLWRLRGKYRWQMCLLAEDVDEMTSALRDLLEKNGPPPSRRVSLVVDVDPVSLL